MSLHSNLKFAQRDVCSLARLRGITSDLSAGGLGRMASCFIRIEEGGTCGTNSTDGVIDDRLAR